MQHLPEWIAAAALAIAGVLVIVSTAVSILRIGRRRRRK